MRLGASPGGATPSTVSRRAWHRPPRYFATYGYVTGPYAIAHFVWILALWSGVALRPYGTCHFDSPNGAALVQFAFRFEEARGSPADHPDVRVGRLLAYYGGYHSRYASDVDVNLRRDLRRKALDFGARGIHADARRPWLRLCPDVLTTTEELDRASIALAALQPWPERGQ